MKAIKRYPCTALYLIIAGLQLVTFWLVILSDSLTPPHIVNLILACALTCQGFEIDSTRIEKKERTREN